MSKITSIKIHVTDPTKNNDKYGSYISYKVTSQITRGTSVSPPITMERRYSDFTWLSIEFGKDFPGVIVPPLPDKQAVGRFNSEFVEARRRALEKFLRRVVAHSDLSESELFLTFLEADEISFQRAKESKKPKSTGSSLTGWFETMASGKLELEKSAADTKIDEISQYIAQLEKQMAATLKHADGLVKRHRETSQAIFELSQSFSSLGQAEADALGKGLTELGTSLDSLSAATAAHAEAEMIKFVEAIDEYYRMIGSIKSAIQQRQQKKDNFAHASADVEGKQTAYRKLVGVPGKEAQAKVKEQSMQSAQELYDTAKLEYEKVSERLLAEFEVFKAQRALDIKEILVDFISLQLEYNRKAEEDWQNLLPKLQLLSLDGGLPVESTHSSFLGSLPPAPPNRPPTPPFESEDD